MRNREFRRLAAGAARAALVLGLLGLVVLAVGPLSAEEAAGEKNSAGGEVVTANLDYREVNYSFINWGLRVTARSAAFNKEPAFSGSKVVRGLLQLGGGATNKMAFLWDGAARKLYLDLNRNLDLTDDRVGVFSCPRSSGESYQTFTNIHLPFETAVGSHATLLDLNLYSYGRLGGSAALRSFWQGKVTLQGEEWQVGLLENPFDQKPTLEGGKLLLRPWAERNQAFSVYAGSADAVPFSGRLFLGKRAYRLQCTNDVPGDLSQVRVEFTEQQPKLGDLKIAGHFLRRLTLEGGPYLVVLDWPEKTVKVPVGTYRLGKVCLQKDGAQAYLDSGTQGASGHITISERASAVLRAGAPLTNSVAISREGRKLSMNYRLVGAGGTYQMLNQDRSHPPEFTVYHGGKKVAAGRFQFG